MKVKDYILNRMYDKNPPGSLEVLRSATVGIAGAGGLGSNIAVSLTRAGVGRMIIVDFDKIEPDNLNRQQYFPDQVGMHKVEALKKNLQRINPCTEIIIHQTRIAPENITTLFDQAAVLVEAFDDASEKMMLVRGWCNHFPNRYIVMASGLAGVGNNNILRTEQQDNVIVCGDQKSSVESEGGYIAPRVAIVANLQANAVLELLLGQNSGK